jgi:hypothetical protein
MLVKSKISKNEYNWSRLENLVRFFKPKIQKITSRSPRPFEGNKTFVYLKNKRESLKT